MPRGVEAIVEPGLLIWARRSASLEIEAAAKKAQIKPERLQSWERGETRPTVSQLRNLGRIYKRPIAVFYLPEPPAEFQALRDFRRLPSELVQKESPELRFEIRRSQNRREFAMELYELVEGAAPFFQFNATLSEDPEEVATKLRGFLAIRYEDQIQWKSGYDSFNRWRIALENSGVLVFQAPEVKVSEMRGFSIYSEQLPAIVVNIKDSLNGRIFTMLHELTHIALHEGGLCDLSEEPTALSQERVMEIFCNRVAGATLVPKQQFLNEKLLTSKPYNSAWTDEEIEWLSERYGASREVILRRLLFCDRITETFYRIKREQLLEEFEINKTREQGGFAPPHRMALSTAGHFFARLVLNNYYQGNINASDVAEFLQVRLRHLSKIESAVLVSSA